MGLVPAHCQKTPFLLLSWLPSLTSAQPGWGHSHFFVLLVLRGLHFFWLLLGMADWAGDLLWTWRET